MAKRVGPRSNQADNNVGEPSPIERVALLRGFHDGQSDHAHPRPYRRLQPIRFAKINEALGYLTEESIDELLELGATQLSAKRADARCLAVPSVTRISTEPKNVYSIAQPSTSMAANATAASECVNALRQLRVRI